MQPQRNAGQWHVSILRTTLSCLAAALTLCSGIALGQAGAKDSQKYENYRADAHEDLVEAQTQLVATVALYNSLVNLEAENPESAYKDLAKAAKKCDDLWKGYGKKVVKMRKQADKMFAAWNKEVESFGNEQMKQLGMERAAAALAAYEYMAEQMDAADEAYAPFSQSLREQATFMSRDLSPEAMALLQPMSEELNSMAQALYAGFEAILEGPPQPDEAVVDVPATEELVEPSSLEEVVEGAASDQP
jgi:hypothetical protein